MFDGLRESWEELPPRRGWPSIVVGLILFSLVMLCVFGAKAQQPAQGLDVKNQVLSARTLSQSNTATFVATRAVQIGDAAACSLQVRFVGDTGFITLTNVQNGIPLPYSIVQLGTGTACNTVYGFY